jgi:hypothetical protein
MVNMYVFFTLWARIFKRNYTEYIIERQYTSSACLPFGYKIS